MEWNTRRFWVQCTLLLCIALFHACALAYDWYWYVWQLDVPMHALGGAWVVLCTYWILYDGVGLRVMERNEVIFLCMTALFVGVGWEVFELYAGIIGTTTADLMDSGKDIVMDLVGAAGASVLVLRGTLGE